MLKRSRQGCVCLPSPWAVSLWHCHILVPNPEVQDLLEPLRVQETKIPAGNASLDQGWVAQPGLSTPGRALGLTASR